MVLLTMVTLGTLATHSARLSIVPLSTTGCLPTHLSAMFDGALTLQINMQKC